MCLIILSEILLGQFVYISLGFLTQIFVPFGLTMTTISMYYIITTTATIIVAFLASLYIEHTRGYVILFRFLALLIFGFQVSSVFLASEDYAMQLLVVCAFAAILGSTM
jgi:hypothetical protein